MKSLRRIAVLVILTITSVATLDAHENTRPEKRVIAFLHATVIPMDRERQLNDQTVIISRGRIVSIGPASKVKIPKNALRIDATGRYLIPALCDMHVHLEG